MPLRDVFSVGPLGRGWSRRAGELGLGAVVLSVVVMMVVPLTPWLIDILIAVNLGFSVLLLCFALFVSTPVSFTVFPTLLLVATLYRLALNISSTRLILLRADAGRIIGAFGGYMVGGDILIGAVIFGILAMVLFLVITKGAERVAEVAARFSLDALPGMQLAIDSDLRLGGISQREAVRRREALDDQSRYFGALDGAMKFVRGDAIVGLIIIVVNIVGGILVGTLRHGLSLLASVNTYGRLTVGDGLVSMIPALLVSTAAGLLVTRVGEEGRAERLGEQVSRQLLSEPRALLATAVLLLVLAFVRALPAWPFLVLSAIFGTLSVNRMMREKRRPSADIPTGEELQARLGGSTTRLVMGRDIFDELRAGLRNGQTLRDKSEALAKTIRTKYGIPIYTVPISRDTETGRRTVVFKVHGGVQEHAVIPDDAVLSRCELEALGNVGVSSLGRAGDLGHWIAQSDASLANAAGLSVEPRTAATWTLFERWLDRAAPRLVGMDETQVLVDRVAADRPVLVRETLPKRVDLPTLTYILGRLAEEGVHLELVPEVLESVAKGPAVSDREALVERVRAGLAPFITTHLRAADDVLSIMVLDDETASLLETALVKGEDGAALALSTDDVGLIVRALRDAVTRYRTRVLLARPHLRRALSDLLRAELPEVRVVKPSELDAMQRVRVACEISV